MQFIGLNFFQQINKVTGSEIEIEIEGESKPPNPIFDNLFNNKLYFKQF